jgi:hypothetical protein
LTNAEVDSAVPIAGTPSRTLTNAAVKQLIADIVAAIATARARSGHTGTQAAETISDFDDAVAALIASTALNALSNVSTASDAVGDGLRFDGVNYVNVKGSDLIRTITGTTDTPTTDDEGKIVRFTNSSPITVTIAPALSGTQLTLVWLASTGTITLDAASGVNLNGLGDGVNIVCSQAAGSVTLIPTGAGTWDVLGSIGDLNATDVAQPFVALTDAATVDTDASLGVNFSVELAGNRTLANPTNMVDGRGYNFRIEQDATGSRTLAYGSKFKFSGGTAPVLTTDADAVDWLSCKYHAASDTLICSMIQDVS